MGRPVAGLECLVRAVTRVRVVTEDMLPVWLAKETALLPNMACQVEVSIPALSTVLSTAGLAMLKAPLGPPKTSVRNSGTVWGLK